MTTIMDFLYRGTLGGVLLLQIVAGATVVLLLAAAVNVLLRRQSAALRHRIWTLSTLAILALPIFILLLPDLGPVWQVTAAPSTGPGAAANVLEVEAMASEGPGANSSAAETLPATHSPHRSDVQHSGLIPLEAAPQEEPGPSFVPLSPVEATNGRSNRPDPALNVVQHPRTVPTGRRAYYLTVGFLGIWLGGFIAGSLALMASEFSANRLTRCALPIANPAIVSLNEELREAVGIGLAVPLLCSSEIAVPMTIGCSRPVILFPANHSHWPIERWRIVLAHELAHIRRRDVLSQLVARLACVIYWCHPLVWFANSRMRVEREFACDDAVLQMGEVPTQYATHLVEVAAALVHQRKLHVHAVAMASGRTLEHRIRGILKPYRNRSVVAGRTGRMLLAATLAIVVVLSLISPSTSQDDRKTTSDAKKGSHAVAPEKQHDPLGEESASSSKTSEKRDEKKLVRIHGTAVDGSGQPVSGAEITAEYGAEKATETTDAEGNFAFEVPSERVSGSILLGSGPDGTLGFAQLPWDTKPADAVPPQRIRLRAPRKIEVKVVGQEGESIHRANVVLRANYRSTYEATTDSEGRAVLAVPEEMSLDFILADAGRKGIDYVSFRQPQRPVDNPYQLPQDHSDPILLTLSLTRSLSIRVVDPDGQPIEGAQIYPWYLTLPNKGGDANLGLLWLKHTNEDGVVEYDNIPMEQERRLTVWVRKAGFVAQERTMVDTRSSDQEITAMLLPLVPVTGRVQYPDGSPAAGINVDAAGAAYGFDNYRETTVTSDDGTFRLSVHPDCFCMIVAGNEKWASSVEMRVVLRNKPVNQIDLKLQPATHVFGQLTSGPEQDPLGNEYVQLYYEPGKNGSAYYELPEEEKLPNPTNSNVAISPRIVRSVRSDENGRFEFYAGPGDFYIVGPRDADRPRFTIDSQDQVEVNLRAARKVEGMLKGRVVLHDTLEHGVAEVKVFGYPMESHGPHLRATTDAAGYFEVLRATSAQLVGAFSEDKTLGSVVHVEAGAESVVLVLSPTATLQGTLTDDQTGQPAVNREVGANIRIAHKDDTFMRAFTRSDTTDNAGNFRITGVIPGHPYELDVVTGRDNEGHPRGWQHVSIVLPERAEVLDLGELTVRKPYQPPTIEDYIARVFARQDDLAWRLGIARTDAEQAYQQILLLISDPGSDATRQFFEARQDYAGRNLELRKALADYILVGVDLRIQRDLLEELQIPLPEGGGAIAIMNPDGRVVIVGALDHLMRDGKLVRSRLTEFLRTRSLTLPDAEEELDSALATASRENKRVLVQVSGPACAPCVLLSRYLTEHEELVSKDYVYLKLDSRMPNGPEAIGRLRNKSEGGIPWMVILSADGNQLATSDAEEGNIGYPSSETGRLHFEQMLHRTRQRLSDAEIAVLMAGLQPTTAEPDAVERGTQLDALEREGRLLEGAEVKPTDRD